MKILLAVAVLALAAACGGPTASLDDAGPASPGDTGGTAAAGAYDGAWKLVSGRGPDGAVPLIEGSRITLTIDGARIGGTAACNSYGADDAISGSSISADDVSVTEMACEPRIMDSEDAYLNALVVAETIERDAGVLVLRGPEVELRFEAQAAAPTADLMGTAWELDSLLDGRGEDATASSASGGHLELSEDGALEGSTGCRELTGEWTERGEEIIVTSLAADGECDPSLRDQDAHVVEVLGDGFTAEVDGDVLTLLSGTRGLQYRAP